MLNSILMLGSTYKNKKLNIIFTITWVVFMLLGSNLKTGIGITFTIMNVVAFGLVFGLGKLFKGKYSNKVISISSILIWSITIDVICYFLYPQFTMGQSIVTYIGNGILFNYKYIFVNALIVSVINFVPVLNKMRIANKTEYQLQLKPIKVN